MTEALLVLADGTEFEGEAIGAPRRLRRGHGRGGVQHRALGLSGDRDRPSYAGQVITFTYPHIGNYGVNADDDESRRPFCAGVVVRDLAPHHSNWRATAEPRRSARAPRCPGHQRASTPAASPATSATRARSRARSAPTRPPVRAAAEGARSTDGIDLVATVTTPEPYAAGSDDAPFRVVAYDFGIKRTILRHLVASGCHVEVVPASTTRGGGARPRARRRVPLQRPRRPRRGGRSHRRGAGTDRARCRCSASASGTRSSASRSAPTPTSCAFGHHGGNHPVRHEATGRVEITSQNHNYAVAADALADGSATHPRQPQRRRGGGLPRARRPRVRRAAPPRGRPRPARRRATCSTTSPP